MRCAADGAARNTGSLLFVLNFMAIDTKHDDLQSLRIDRTSRGDDTGGPPAWARRYIIIGIAIVALLSLSALAYRLLSPDAPEVEVVRAAAQDSDVAGTVLSATGYIVAHHTINVNSKVTGRLAWIGVEKGDRVKEGQVLVRLEDQEFRAAYGQAEGAVQNARAYLDELQHGSRPEEIQQAQHNLDEARATLANDTRTLDRTKELAAGGVVSRQVLDDATAKFESDQQRANSLEKAFQLMKIGPRQEEISRARGAMAQAQGQLDYAKAQLDATVIRAPVTGTILDRTAEKGELITAQFASAAAGGPQGSVVSLADLNDLQVELDIAQADFARLSPKQKGVVSVDAYPDKSYDGVIAQISPEANRQKATVQVKVQVLNPDKYPDVSLRPEMNATVKFLANETPKSSTQLAGVFVPSAAIRERDGKKIVLIAFNGKAVAREVHVVGQRSDGALVDGLVGGESVVTNGPANLKDGQSIKIKGQS
jgi:HlyD family secretion protein